MLALRFRLLLASAAFAALPATGSADPIRLARDPHIHGGTIAFSYHGDIWLADANGANPRRLTSHVARDANPRFSPDGRWVAFSSNRMGNYDVFVVPVTGGEPARAAGAAHGGSASERRPVQLPARREPRAW